MSVRTEGIDVDGGVMPAVVNGPERSKDLPALLVVPSIFGPAPDLIRRLGRFADRALVVIPDPFFRKGGGVVDYGDHETAMGRLADFDFRRCIADLGAALDWASARSSGRVVGLGICFGGSFVLRYAAQKRLCAVVTWHGSRMETVADRAAEVTCPLRLHFGEKDPITPPATLDKLRAAFGSHPDASIVVHPSAVHGFSHDGDGYDERACAAGLDAVDEMLVFAT